MNTSKTLLAILVEELPKRGGWPAGASHAGYKITWDGVSFTKGGAPGFNGDDLSIFTFHDADERAFWMTGPGFDCDKPVDYATAIITRDQYEAALAAHQPHYVAPCKEDGECNVVRCEAHDAEFYTLYRRDEKGLSQAVSDHKTQEEAEAALAAVQSPAEDADGWIEWHGGECPVEEGTLVEVKYRSERPYHIKGVNPAGEWCWSHDDHNGDIIAYRLHQPQGVTKVEINAPECVLKGAGTLHSRANDDRLAQDLLELSQARATSAWDKLESLGYFYNGAQWCASVGSAEADLNDCIGQPAEDKTLVTFDLLAEIQDADITISLNDAFELAEHLIDVGFRKQ